MVDESLMQASVTMAIVAEEITGIVRLSSRNPFHALDE